MGRWGTYPKNNGDPQCDVEPEFDDEGNEVEAVDHTDEELAAAEERAERRIERDNDKW